jgi:hypothetical protein
MKVNLLSTYVSDDRKREVDVYKKLDEVLYKVVRKDSDCTNYDVLDFLTEDQAEQYAENFVMYHE